MATGSTTGNISLPRRGIFFAIGLLTLVSMASSSPAFAGDFLREFNDTLNQTTRGIERFQREQRRREAIERQRQAREARERQRQEAMERRRQEAERQRQIYESMTPEEQAEYRARLREEQEAKARILFGILGAAMGGGGGGNSSANEHICSQNPSLPACGGASPSSPMPQAPPTPPIDPFYGDKHW